MLGSAQRVLLKYEILRKFKTEKAFLSNINKSASWLSPIISGKKDPSKKDKELICAGLREAYSETIFLTAKELNDACLYGKQLLMLKREPDGFVSKALNQIRTGKVYFVSISAGIMTDDKTYLPDPNKELCCLCLKDPPGFCHIQRNSHSITLFAVCKKCFQNNNLSNHLLRLMCL